MKPYMTIDRILASFQTPTDTTDQLIKVGICIKPDLELLQKNEYYQCIRVGNNEPSLLLKHMATESELKYIFERNTTLTLTKYKNFVYYNVNMENTVIQGEITPTIQRLIKPISMSTSTEVDKIPVFIK